MKKFILLYKGPAMAPGALRELWPKWMEKVGERMVDMGSPMEHGLSLLDNGSTGDATPLTGYSTIQAETMDEAIELARAHPFLAVSKNGEYSLEVFELTRA